MAGRGAYQEKAKNIENVRARHKLLIDGIEQPAKLNKAVHATLVGQRAFAALSLPDSKIMSIALNTIKSLADELYTKPDKDGRTGFAHLDALRIRLMKKLAEAAAKRTIKVKTESVADKIEKFETRISDTEAHSLKRQIAYFSLYAMLNGLIKNGELQPDAQERLYRALEDHHATFSDLFEPNFSESTGHESNVTKMR